MNNTTPKQLADILSEIRDPEHVLTSQGAGAGYGRMTVSQVCERDAIDPAVALQKLAEAGISASESDNLRTLADRYDLEPVRIVELISGESR